MGPMALDTDINEAHKSRARQAADPDPTVGGIAADRLRSIVERIERLEEEKKALANDIKDIFSEAKASGFDVKALRALLSLRKKEPAEVEELDTLLQLYRHALGMG
jgi:uncharacterized protein (UPF0335 family)